MENEKDQTPTQEKAFLLQTEELVKRNEEAVKKFEELVKRNEETARINLLGGKADAGLQAPKPKEETPQEYAKRIMGA